jgi:hypothetical protein
MELIEAGPLDVDAIRASLAELDEADRYAAAQRYMEARLQLATAAEWAVMVPPDEAARRLVEGEPRG